MRLISFSLWGRDPKYVVGAVRNAELAARLYPGWICRYYCGSSVGPETLAALRRQPNVQVAEMGEPGDWRGLFWRFQPAADPHVSVMLSRDADCRLSARERAAVDAWLASDKDVHVMRDHPQHARPILGGMWGVRNGRLREIGGLMEVFPRQDRWQTDQDFLAEVIAPEVGGHWIEHDPYYAGKPFPTRRRGREFVGQPFDADDRPLVRGPAVYEAALGRWSRPFPRVHRALRAVRDAFSCPHPPIDPPPAQVRQPGRHQRAPWTEDQARRADDA